MRAFSKKDYSKTIENEQHKWKNSNVCREYWSSTKPQECFKRFMLIKDKNIKL